jgi:integrase
VFGTTNREAAAKLRRALTAKDEGRVLPASTDTVEAFLRDWIEGQRPNLRRGTWVRYEQLLRVHVFPQLGSRRLSALEPEHVARLYAGLLAAGVSPSNVHHVHRVLHRGLGQAVRWNKVARNAAALVDPPRRERRDMSTLTAEQVRRLLEVSTIRDRPFYLLAVSTGMRLGELLALRWADVDLRMASLRVVRTVRKVSGEGWVFGAPKTQRSMRRIELSEDVVEALSAHKVAQVEERWRAGQLWQDNDLVFPGITGRPRQGSHILRDFYPTLERAELPRVRFHDLRHTAATLMLSSNVHPKVVSEILGHANIAITLDTYSHVLPTMQRDAARLMAGLLR